MFKKIIPVIVISLLFSCSKDSEFESNENESKINARIPSSSFEKNLSEFATTHVLLNNQIIYLLENETNVSFANFPYGDLESSQDRENFEVALAAAGVIKYKELSSLILNQSQNAVNFLKNNRDFALLKEEEKKTIITDAIDVAIIENPISVLPENPDNTTFRSCSEQRIVDVDRCNRDGNIAGAVAIVACVTTGPFGCFVACMAAVAQIKNCIADAKEDYEDCIK